MESLLWNPCCGFSAGESLLWNPCCGILAVESLLWNLCCGIFAVESLLWNPCCGILAVDSLASGNHLGSIWEPSGKHLGGIHLRFSPPARNMNKKRYKGLGFLNYRYSAQICYVSFDISWNFVVEANILV